jgi:hypothetical protein
VARIVARRPAIGIAAGLIFGALGWLLIGLPNAPAGATRPASVLFAVAGYFFLFVAVMAFVAAARSFFRSFPRR